MYIGRSEPRLKGHCFPNIHVVLRIDDLSIPLGLTDVDNKANIELLFVPYQYVVPD